MWTFFSIFSKNVSLAYGGTDDVSTQSNITVTGSGLRTGIVARQTGMLSGVHKSTRYGPGPAPNSQGPAGVVVVVSGVVVVDVSVVVVVSGVVVVDV